MKSKFSTNTEPKMNYANHFLDNTINLHFELFGKNNDIPGLNFLLLK